MPYLSRITVYPIKSLDGVDLPQGEITTGGALKHDRQFALFDPKGKYVNGKNNNVIQKVRSTFDLKANTVTLIPFNDVPPATFHLDRDREWMGLWLGSYLQVRAKVEVRENQTHGFPDDTKASGPTIVSQSSLEQASSWFQGLDSQEMGRRMRANLEITTDTAFWEDCLFGKRNAPREFAIGNVKFWGTNPCSRCIVPTRNSLTGEVNPKFQGTFSRQRRRTLTEGVDRSPFSHFYKFTVNTIIPASESGKVLHLGDEIKLL